MASMKLILASAAVVFGAGVDHVLPGMTHMDDSHMEAREMEAVSSDDSYFTPRGFYGSSRIEDEFERKEVDCTLLKGNQTLPAQCCTFANATETEEKPAVFATNSTASFDHCYALEGLARLECLGLKFAPVNDFKARGTSTLPMNATEQFAEETEQTETIFLEEAKQGDELTWGKAWKQLFPELVISESQLFQDVEEDSCVFCQVLDCTVRPAKAALGPMVTKMAFQAYEYVLSLFEEKELEVDAELDCSMQLGNKTMTAECSKILDPEFEYYQGEAKATQEPRISAVGDFIVEDIDCSKIKGDQTLPWECMKRQMNATSTSWF